MRDLQEIPETVTAEPVVEAQDIIETPIVKVEPKAEIATPIVQEEPKSDANSVSKKGTSRCGRVIKRTKYVAL